MEGAADQELANGRGGVPRGTGLPPICGGGLTGKKRMEEGGGCSSSTVLDSKEPPAEAAIQRLDGLEQQPGMWLTD